MSTRGFQIIHFDGKYYVYYNSNDSYPENLGRKIVAAILKELQGKSILQPFATIASTVEFGVKHGRK